VLVFKNAMPLPTPLIPQDFGAMSAPELRAKVMADKAARRRYLLTAPIPEKLRILEEMRDATQALKDAREANKAKVRRASKSQTE
jgi:hypothetical protein